MCLAQKLDLFWAQKFKLVDTVKNFWSLKKYLHLISDLLFQSSGEEELQLQLALAMSKEEADEAVRALLQSLPQNKPPIIGQEILNNPKNKAELGQYFDNWLFHL